MARHAKYPRRPRRVASERLYTGGTRSVASALERRCSACADLAKTDVATTPGIPGYATIGLFQGAGICAAPRGWEVALLRDRMPTNMARHAKYPRRPRRVALWGVSRRSGSWRRRPTFYKMWAGANHVYMKERQEVSRGCAKHLRNGRGASFPAIGVSILPEKKGEGALMARIPPVADTDGTDLALPLEVARRSGSICVGEAGAVIPSHTSR